MELEVVSDSSVDWAAVEAVEVSVGDWTIEVADGGEISVEGVVVPTMASASCSKIVGIWELAPHGPLIELARLTRRLMSRYRS